LLEAQQEPHISREQLGTLSIAFVEHKYIPNLENARLKRLHGIAHTRNKHHHAAINHPNHINLDLTNSNRLEKNHVNLGSIKHRDRIKRCSR
jgi:hypothetical protein